MSNQTKHTEGPWRIRELVNDELAIYGQGEFDIVTPRNGGLLCGDARLIAAAPELLEALVEIIKLYLCPAPKTKRDWSARCDVMASYAREAIAKAEGRS